MKTKVQCPNCQSKNIKSSNRKAQIMFAAAMMVSGAIFLFFALTTAIGYYLFALPLITVGIISTYKGYTYAQGHVQCNDCHTEFEYYLEQRSAAPSHEGKLQQQI